MMMMMMMMMRDKMPSMLLCIVLSILSAEAYKDAHCLGDRHGIVHLFEWKWQDIAAECQHFLGPYGFCAVQTSPASENRVILSPSRPWYERYQPVSYRLQTRSGNQTAFQQMVETCQEHGVRIYVDVVINHMAKAESQGQGYGTGGSSFNADRLDFPAVPYSVQDFNNASKCHSHDLLIHDYHDIRQVRNCRLDDLPDLAQDQPHVLSQLTQYLNNLIKMGVAGFRVDAAKHMWPRDLSILLDKVQEVNWGGRPFVYQEVIDLGGEPIKAEEYFTTGRVTNFKFGKEIARVFRRQIPMKWLKSWGPEWGMWSSEQVVNFIDNHDNQRGHGAGGGVLTHWEARPYKMATAFMLAHPYGVARIMSSYEYNRGHDYEGPPHNQDMTIKTVTFSPLNKMICQGGWTCEHRWRQIYNMVAFRNIAQGTRVDNWWAGADYQIAFSRGDKAFIVFNLESWDIDTILQTGLPAGTYCDVISGNLDHGQCTGRHVTVMADGKASIFLSPHAEDPMLAIHIGAKLGSPGRRLMMEARTDPVITVQEIDRVGQSRQNDHPLHILQGFGSYLYQCSVS